MKNKQTTPHTPTQGPLAPLTVHQVRKEIEHRLGYLISRSHTYRMLTDGRLTAIRIGSKWLVPRESIEMFIKVSLAGEKF